MRHPLKIFIVVGLFSLFSESGFCMDGQDLKDQLMGGVRRLSGTFTNALKKWSSQGDVRRTQPDPRGNQPAPSTWKSISSTPIPSEIDDEEFTLLSFPPGRSSSSHSPPKAISKQSASSRRPTPSSPLSRATSQEDLPPMTSPQRYQGAGASPAHPHPPLGNEYQNLYSAHQTRQNDPFSAEYVSSSRHLSQAPSPSSPSSRTPSQEGPPPMTPPQRYQSTGTAPAYPSSGNPYSARQIRQNDPSSPEYDPSSRRLSQGPSPSSPSSRASSQEILPPMTSPQRYQGAGAAPEYAPLSRLVSQGHSPSSPSSGIPTHEEVSQYFRTIRTSRPSIPSPQHEQRPFSQESSPSFPSRRDLFQPLELDLLGLWTFSPKEDAPFILHCIPQHYENSLPNLPATYNWIRLLIPRTEDDGPYVNEEFVNLCKDILAIKAMIANEAEAKNHTTGKKDISAKLLSKNRTSAFLYSIFAFQSVAWHGNDQTPLIQSYKNIVVEIWEKITKKHSVSLSSKKSILKYIFFIAKTDVHTFFTSLDQQPTASPFTPSPPLNPPAPDSFTKARDIPRSLERDLTIIKRCLEVDAFEKRASLCNDYFLKLFDRKEIQEAVFHNILYFLESPSDQYPSLFQDTYPYLYSLVVFETFDLKNPLNTILDKQRHFILQKIYEFYGARQKKESPNPLSDFYTTLLFFQKRDFPSMTLHEKFDEILDSLTSKHAEEARQTKQATHFQPKQGTLRKYNSESSLTT